MNNLEILKTGIENFGLEATEEKLQNLKKYREILVEWNKVMNLTGIEEEREVYIKHFLDSISAVTNNYINDDISLIDVGTGAGFPGMPLKICLDNLKLTLLDSLNKRINFLNDVKEKIKLENMEAIHSRAEEFCQNKKYREKFDIAVSRAVANLSVLAEYLLPAVKVGGQVICMKGSQVEEELNDAKFALKELGGKIKSVDEFCLPGTDMKRNVIIVEKIKETPKKYPRKAGTPAKQPLK